jgi:predicted small lipoprotein YifL
VIDISAKHCARIAAVAAIAAALGLSACGRKGPLDPPPYAAAYDNPQGAPADPALAARDAQVGVNREGKAVAPARTKENRPFILDWLVE